jgi:hypothetical protein
VLIGRESDPGIVLAAEAAAGLSRPTGGRPGRQADGSRLAPAQPGGMTNNAHTIREAHNTGNAISRITRQISPRLAACAGGLAAVGIAIGVIRYLQRSPIRDAPVPGTSAWAQHLIAGAVACVLYGVARWRRSRRPGRGRGRLLLLAPLGRRAAARLWATMQQVSWRSAAALPPQAVIGYSFWRAGEQVTAGLDPNFTVNAWGGPTYLGAMACHYLDATLMIAVSAWLLDRILRPAAAEDHRPSRTSLGSSSDVAGRQQSQSWEHRVS